LKRKKTYKEVTENFDASSKNLKSESKEINYDAVETSSKSQNESKKFDAIDRQSHMYVVIMWWT